MTDLNQQTNAAASEARQATQAISPALDSYSDNVLFGTYGNGRTCRNVIATPPPARKVPDLAERTKQKTG